MTQAAPRCFNILVMHNDPLLCVGLVEALRQHASFEIFLDGVDTVSLDGPMIDVVVADYLKALSLTDPAVRTKHRALAGCRILALTSNDRESDIRRALEAGIHGYLLLGGPLEELVNGLTAVASGMRYLCQTAAQRMADSLTRTPLTVREIEVLRLVVDGEPNKAIARALRIEVETVKTHMKAIMPKLGAISRTQAARIAAARGLIEERPSTRSVLAAPAWSSLDRRTQAA